MALSDIASILEKSREPDRLRKGQGEVLVEINMLHKKLQAIPEVVEKPGDSSLSRLKSLYIQAKVLSKREVTYLLELDDDEEDGALPQQTVPFHKVVLLPDGHRQ